MVRILTRNKACLAVLFLLPMLAYAQGTSFNFGDFSFSLTPRILEDGSITDLSLGMIYSEPFGGEIRLRNTQTAKNEEIPDTDDSLNAIKETIYELFVLPFQYRFVYENLQLTGGAGLYYEYDKLEEKGFFTLDSLVSLGKERLNSYKNDFAMHLVGPLLDGKVHYNAEWLNIGLTVGIVPVFYTGFTQKLGIDPLMSPNFADLSENTWGSPYFYISLDSIILKYVNATFSYNYASLTKKVIDFDGDLNWIYPKQTAVTQSIMIEISALLPTESGISFQIGYGYMHNFISLDSAPVIQEGKHYLIISTKKFKF